MRDPFKHLFIFCNGCIGSHAVLKLLMCQYLTRIFPFSIGSKRTVGAERREGIHKTESNLIYQESFLKMIETV